MEQISLDHLPEGEWIRESVKQELSRNSLLKDENILVDAFGDEVILQGNVDSLDKKWLAEDIASDTFGVLHVKNEINVKNQMIKNDQRGDFMRIDKKTKKERHYHGLEEGAEVKIKKAWPKDVPIKNFRPVAPTEKTEQEEKFNIDTGLS